MIKNNWKKKEGKMSKILNKSFCLLLIIIFCKLGFLVCAAQNIPDNYYTYTYGNSFNISLPKNWEPNTYLIESQRRALIDYGKTHKIEDLFSYMAVPRMIFVAGILLDDGSYNPSINIVKNCYDFYPNLEMLNLLAEDMDQTYSQSLKNYKKISQRTENINGTQAILLEFEGQYPAPNYALMYFLQTIFSYKVCLYTITCVVASPLNFKNYRDDFYTISRSFKFIP